jgi:hypothetical protein
LPTIFWHSSGLTKEGKFDKESVIRLERAFKVYVKLIRNKIPLSQMYFLSSVGVGNPAMSELMKITLEEWGIRERIIISRQSTHTLADILNSFKLIKENNLPQPIINVSSWYHIPRIWLIWFLLRKKFGHPKLKFIASGATHFSWILKEPGKIIRTLKQLKNEQG